MEWPSLRYGIGTAYPPGSFLAFLTLLTPHGEGPRKGGLNIACPDLSGLFTVAAGASLLAVDIIKNTQSNCCKSWNVRTPLDINKSNMDITTVGENYLHGEDSQPEVGKPFSGGVLLKTPGASMVEGLRSRIPEPPTGVNERLMTWRIRLAEGLSASLISAYAPTLKSDNDCKESYRPL